MSPPDRHVSKAKQISTVSKAGDGGSIAKGNWKEKERKKVSISLRFPGNLTAAIERSGGP